MTRFANTIIVILLLLGGVFVYGQQTNWQFFSKPCTNPIYYSLGVFSDQFGLNQNEFLQEVEFAVSVWEIPSNKNLFEYSPSGKLKINLVYDYRQQTTQKLKDLGITIDNSESSYNNLKNRYDALVIQYNSLKQGIDQQIADYNQKSSAYEQSVRYWNSHGGAPPKTAKELNQQRNELNAQANQINSVKDQLNSMVDEINALASTLNRMAADLNLNVSTYNSVGESRGSEFEEGLYKSEFGSREIDIYEFTDEKMLQRVLAHELGHALGLEHVADSDAIMYKLNQSKNGKANSADITELKRVCRIQ